MQLEEKAERQRARDDRKLLEGTGEDRLAKNIRQQMNQVESLRRSIESGRERAKLEGKCSACEERNAELGK